VHSSVERAVETQRNSVGAASQCHLGGPMSGDKGPRTMKACRLHCRGQDRSLNLLRSSVQGAVEAGNLLLCTALQCHLGSPMASVKGTRT
jgi:hypothetical protein